MSDIDIAVARVIALARGRAWPIRVTSTLSPDPKRVFGMAPIRVVSEQRVQAIAFGLLTEEPRIISLWNPLSRDAGRLEELAQALDDYLFECLDNSILPRIWVPHAPALEIIDLLGHRYRNNPNASPALQRLGAQCRILANETQFEGQQVVAVAGQLLATHVVTGQSPVEDHQLGALLAWINPLPGIDPAAEAQRRSLIPAAAMLERSVDDEVERLRKIAKGRGQRALEARATIEELLEEEARQEWDLLVEARASFWGLDLPSVPGLARLERLSMERLNFSLRRNLPPPSSAHALAGLLDSQKYAHELVEDIDVRGDLRMREQAREEGHVIRTRVVAIDQPRPRYFPCRLTLRVEQEVVRIRPGAVLQTFSGTIDGRIRDTGEDESGRTLFEFDVTRGVQASDFPRLGSEIDWTDTIVINMQGRNRAAYRAMRDANSPFVYGPDLPVATPRAQLPADLLAAADQLRRTR